jgi:hypothetical protein
VQPCLGELFDDALHGARVPEPRLACAPLVFRVAQLAREATIHAALWYEARAIVRVRGARHRVSGGLVAVEHGAVPAPMPAARRASIGLVAARVGSAKVVACDDSPSLDLAEP